MKNIFQCPFHLILTKLLFYLLTYLSFFSSPPPIHSGSSLSHLPRFTENGYATFLATGDPCLDLFFHIVPDTPASYLNSQLPKAWSESHDSLLVADIVDGSIKLYDLALPPASNPLRSLHEHTCEVSSEFNHPGAQVRDPLLRLEQVRRLRHRHGLRRQVHQGLGRQVYPRAGVGAQPLRLQ